MTHVSEDQNAIAKKRRRQLAVRGLLFFVGVAILAAFIRKVGVDEIVLYMRRLGWGFLALVALNVVWRGFASWATTIIVNADHDVPFWKLFLIRSAGESINMLAPLGNVGGEPVKAMMLAREIGGATSTGLVVIDKTIFFIAGMLFMIIGCLLGAGIFVENPAILGVSVVIIALWVGGLAWVVRRQAKGDLVVRASRLLRLFRVELAPKTMTKLERIDAGMSRFWRHHPRRFVAAAVVHLMGRSLRAVDVWLCVTLLGASITLSGAYVTTAIGMLINATFFFIPNGIGVAEGGFGYLFEVLGPGAAVGVTVALARRIRNYFVAALGYLIVIFWPTAKKVREAQLAPATPETLDAPGD